MNKLLALFVLAGLFPCVSCAGDIGSPGAAVEKFLSWEAKVQPSGAYKGLTSTELKDMLSRELLCLLDAAQKANELSVRAAPEDKPPYIEGNLFLPSAWDRPKGSQILAVNDDGRTAKVDVRFKYVPDGDDDTNRFYLKQASNGWRIIEIVRRGSCDFCQSGGLRASLYKGLRAFPRAGAKQCRAKF
ncbi:hypothetical protein GM658_18855 [Pseudoduganella eburnea]|uniref:DUF3828 domain-containing protein n=1 Tax=Massilia eburnea TaxID=1776165 RepID=A0A6L6QKQ7_9BURK|nr:hypothetical protein [Massilia eburnea]MTW12674.1 hypothetical protein [Massilia eburnea]